MNKIGEGRYGVCFLAKLKGKRVVVKKYKTNFFKRYDEKNKFEPIILSRLDHKSIPKLIDIIDEKNFKGIVIEEKIGYTVEHMLFKQKHSFLKKEIYNIGKQLIQIISYLHKNNIVHRDIRIPNIIINEDTVSLVDFGLARFIDDKVYTRDIDFSYLGDLLLYLLYSSIEVKEDKKIPWYDELMISNNEKLFLKKLLRLEEPYKTIEEIEYDFGKLYRN